MKKVRLRACGTPVQIELDADQVSRFDGWWEGNEEGQAVDEPAKHNYMKKLLKLQAEGKLPKVGIHDVSVAHDDWCQVYKGGYCNCDPDIKLRKPLGGRPSRN